jgi:hypothetical protein
VTEKQYNPLDKLNLGKSVAEALLDRPPSALDDLPVFDGAGIYAIYYTGSFEIYAPLAKRNQENMDWPIYIGKAIPTGGRKGATPFSDVVGKYLWNRLSEHADSIRATKNLRIADFKCRHLVVDDIWIPLGETLLISQFKPPWNVVLDGFGNHDPGSGRYLGYRPMWDVVHPGRTWALKCRERKESLAELKARVRKFLEDNNPPSDPHVKFAPPEA